MTSMIAPETVLGPTWTFGDKLRKIRREIAGVSQARMAALVGANASTYSAWEGGRATPSRAQGRIIAQRIQSAFPLQVSAAWILSEQDGPIPVDTSYLALIADAAPLPRMDSNHQPPDVGFKNRIAAGLSRCGRGLANFWSHSWETPANQTLHCVNYQMAVSSRKRPQPAAGVYALFAVVTG